MIDVTCFNWIKMVQKSKLGAYEKSVAHYLSTYMNQNQDVAWPSQSRMFTEMSIGKSTLNRALNQLELKGWLVRERGSPTKNTRYLINVPSDAIELAIGGSPTQALKGSPTEGLVPHRDEGSATQGLGVVPQGDTNNKLITSNNNVGRASRFTPPTLEELKTYVKEKKYRGFDCDRFMDHYTSNGWKVGKNPMKSWSSAANNWNRNNTFSNNAQSKAPSAKDTFGV